MVKLKTEEWLEAHRDYPYEDWCLFWPFTRDKREGRAKKGKNLAHRVMCEMVNGPAPEDKPQAVHSCGNGHLGCVNPRHLSWATNSENQHQRYAHGRTSFHRQGNRSRFTPDQIETMRSLYGKFTQEKLAEIYGVSIPTIQYYLKYRETRGHASGKIKHWCPEEEDALRVGVAGGMGFNQISLILGRTSSAVSEKAYRLGLKSGRSASQINALQ